MTLPINDSQSHSNYPAVVIPQDDTLALVPQDNAQALSLPLDIFFLIFKGLPVQGIRACESVCKKWNLALHSQRLCRALLEDHFPNTNPDAIKDFRKAYQALYSNINFNLPRGVCTSRIIPGHDKGMVRCLTVAGGELYSSSYYDHTIKIWNIKTDEYIRTLQGHEGPVFCFTIAGGNLCSGSADRTIKIWNIKTGECIRTLQGHKDMVSDLAAVGADEGLCSGSDDRTIKIWNIKTGECIRTLQGHKGQISSLAAAGNKIYSSSCDCTGTILHDYTIKIWNRKTGECINSLQGHEDIVPCLVVAGENLFSGSWDRSIKIWNRKTGEYIATPQERGEEYWLIVVGGKLYSCSENGTIKVWDIQTRKCITAFQRNKDWVNCVAVAPGGKFYSGSHDGTITVLDFTASQGEIFKEIADMLETGTPQATQQAFELFLKMPEPAKNAIYEKLYEICNPFLVKLYDICKLFAKDHFTKDYLEWGEDTFHNQNEQSSTPVQKAQAIRNYLNDQHGKPSGKQ